MESKTGDEEEVLSSLEAKISQNTSIRLVRGVSGSGKTLVLAQRARYLAAQYPEWEILVLTYNRQLREHFEAVFKGFPNIKPLTFHKLCRIILRKNNLWKVPTNPTDWLSSNKADYPILGKLGVRYVEDEIKWIKETDISNRESYLTVERKGRGGDRRLSRNMREQLYEVLLGYQTFLDEQGFVDWANVPHLVLDGLKSGEISSPNYDAILIDESQDFAPVWIKLVTRLLNPDHGVFFLADDPAQSIYRFYSWKEKGVHVVGRTRWLKVPYRNTYEIYIQDCRNPWRRNVCLSSQS
jgi:superfamily I DNA/RNA helicase